MDTQRWKSLAAVAGRWSAGLLFAALLAAVAALAVGRIGYGLRYEPVLTGSMSPGLPTGSLLVLAPVDATRITAGQVIAFRPPKPYGEPGGAPVVHRVASLTQDSGTTVLTTKGDANPVADPWHIDLASGTYSREVAHIPYAGQLVILVRSIGLTGFAAIATGFLALVLAARALRASLQAPAPAAEPHPVGTVTSNTGTSLPQSPSPRTDGTPEARPRAGHAIPLPEPPS